MTENDIKQKLKDYKESYAPWEMDEMDCPPYMEGSMISFGVDIYNRAIDDAEKQSGINLDNLKIK